jgi:hypothetical protein
VTETKTQREENLGEKKLKSIQEQWGTIRRSNMYVIEITEGHGERKRED